MPKIKDILAAKEGAFSPQAVALATSLDRMQDEYAAHAADVAGQLFREQRALGLDATQMNTALARVIAVNEAITANTEGVLEAVLPPPKADPVAAPVIQAAPPVQAQPAAPAPAPVAPAPAPAPAPVPVAPAPAPVAAQTEVKVEETVSAQPVTEAAPVPAPAPAPVNPYAPLAAEEEEPEQDEAEPVAAVAAAPAPVDAARPVGGNPENPVG